MKGIWWLLLGALLMFVLLKIMSKASAGGSVTFDRFKELARSQQVANLIKTNEFREVVKTGEFKRFAASLADDQLLELSKTLV